MDAGAKTGFRNAQVTVLAPTGTIGFMMDCDTTGVEPDIALVKYKLLAGGGMLKIVNKTVPMALERLGYAPEDIKAICDYIDEHETIEGAPEAPCGPPAVFDCAFKPRNGKRFIHYMAHLKMMAAVQPFISGAISKTINMPKESTTEEIVAAYMEGWKLGLKAVAIYRDGSKRLQPVSTDKHKDEKAKAGAEAATAARPFRRRLPDTRHSITHKFSVAGHEGYLTVGLYEDGQPGELFITMAKEGSTVGGLMDVIGTCTSMALQYGVPLITLVDKFRHARFEPSGMTCNRDIPFAKSLIDYIFCWLGCQFIPGYADKNLPNRTGGASPGNKTVDDRPRAGRKDQGPRPQDRRGQGRRQQRQGKKGKAERGQARGDRCPRQADSLSPSGPHRPAKPGRIGSLSRSRRQATGGRSPAGRSRPHAAVQRPVRALRRRRPGLRHLRLDHRPQRHLLQVLQLRQLHGMLVRIDDLRLIIDDSGGRTQSRPPGIFRFRLGRVGSSPKGFGHSRLQSPSAPDGEGAEA